MTSKRNTCRPGCPYLRLLHHLDRIKTNLNKQWKRLNRIHAPGWVEYDEAGAIVNLAVLMPTRHQNNHMKAQISLMGELLIQGREDETRRLCSRHTRLVQLKVERIQNILDLLQKCQDFLREDEP
jgi:hypothetical protein